MGNIQKKAAMLHAMMSEAGLLHKEATEQVKEKKLDAPQTAIGDQMQKETEQGTQGNYASDPKVDASIKGVIEPGGPKVQGPDDKKADAVLAETGTPVKDMAPCGAPSGTPSQVVKSAALQRKLAACVEAQIKKAAAFEASEKEKLEKQATVKEDEVITATEVLSKIASLADLKTAADVEALTADIDVSFVKLASTNPLFNVACEQALMRKMAAEVDALAAAEGISPEQAAAALDAAVASDPAAMEELNNEAEGEALSDLATAEQDQAALMSGLDQTAAEVSNMVGAEVTADDLIEAVNEVVEQADQLGVDPMDLIAAAGEELASAGGEGAPADAQAEADAALGAAAEKGVSPEEAIKGMSEPAPTDQALAKQACLKKLAATKRGANLLKILEAAGK